MFAVVGAAVVLRIGQYLFNKSLWLDEANLGLEIMRRPFSAALHPTGQIAPTAFMWSVKGVTLAAGDSELALRLVPLLFGLASVFLFYFVASRYLDWPASFFAVGLFAVSDRLIYYSSELKQYSADLAVALLLFLVMAGAGSPKFRWRDALLAGLAGAVGVWFSHPSIFVMAGLGTTALWLAWRAGDREQTARLVLAISLWTVSFAVSYVLTIRNVSAETDAVRAFWGWAFAPVPPRSFADLRWFPEMFTEFFRDPAGFVLPGIAVFAFLAGCFWMYREHPGRCLALVSPFFFALLASALHLYPFSGRLILFLVPLALLLIAHGAERLRAAIAPTSRLAAATLVLLVVAPPAADAAYRLVRPRTTEEIRPVMDQIAKAWNAGDRLYVYYGARPSFEYYASRYAFSAADVSFGTSSRDDWQRYFDELDALRGQRVWIVFTHVYNWGPVDEEQLFLYRLDHHGSRLREIRGRRASAYLFDLSSDE
jgi:hypothetical protein